VARQAHERTSIAVDRLACRVHEAPERLDRMPLIVRGSLV
jgi:hypothetical protein